MMPMAMSTPIAESHYNPSEEYELMAAAGMDARQILASLTTIPAEQIGETGRSGRIANGQAADLVVLDKDPILDARYFASVRFVIRDGRVIYRANRTPLIRK
jgi:imidazolonepropionase-like amidohydrolase